MFFLQFQQEMTHDNDDDASSLSRRASKKNSSLLLLSEQLASQPAKPIVTRSKHTK
jgi:hypothetical protein